MSSEEESQRSNQIASRTLMQSEPVHKKQQEQEDAEFKKLLEEKDLKQLMQLRRQQQDEAEQKASELSAVKRGDLGALSPYIKSAEHEMARLDKQDAERNKAIIANEHLRIETFITPLEEGQDPVQKADRERKWLKETFPTLKTEVTFVKDIDGNSYTATLGVSLDEVNAAKHLQAEKDRIEERSAEVTARIQERIKEGPQKTTDGPSDQAARTLATPVVLREATKLGSALRG